ncbi:hypothetical protein JKP88DRAFT_248300 [Tribonema minus]|uniref:histidine kinase n=1 Tax=Tribonema minus TaxID=303371 RepID=A0A835YMS3_9STRA|nr:hypothetical protein JKP88DRAFT_248300 [Tribonema minus]
MRVIHNVHGSDSPIVGGERPVDLSMSSLRAVSKVHIAYLKNMNVRAAMSIAIIVNGDLWGLYAFHSHSCPVSPSAEQRISLEVTASLSSSRIEAFLHADVRKRKLALMTALEALPEAHSISSFLDGHVHQLLRAAKANAVVLSVDGHPISVYGDKLLAPTEEGARELSRRCHMDETLILNDYGAGGIGRGVAHMRTRGMQLSLMRTSSCADVVWGGNPDDAKLPTLGGVLQPRASFEAYLEKSRHESHKWDFTDREIVAMIFEHMRHYRRAELLKSFELSLERANSDFVDSEKLLRDSPDMSGEERRDIVDGAIASGDGLLKTLNDILTIAKAKYKVTLNMHDFSAVALLYDSVATMSTLASRKSVDLVVEQNVRDIHRSGETVKADALAKVYGDANMVVQVINNLISNAIEFVDTGRVTVRMSAHGSYGDACSRCRETTAAFHNSIRTHRSEDLPPDLPSSWTSVQAEKAVWYNFEVEDTGPGIGSETEMFEMMKAYHQLSSGRCKTYQGSGLGLHICLTHCKNHGGLLAVGSTVGVGTVFVFIIPMMLTEEKGERRAATSGARTRGDAARASGSAVSGGVYTPQLLGALIENAVVLIVDDSALNVKLCKRKITLALGKNTSCMSAEDGQQAVDMYRDSLDSRNADVPSRFDAVLMDFHMPRLSGKNAIIQMRQMERERGVPPVPIAACTADVGDMAKASLLNAGATVVLTKPTPAGLMEQRDYGVKIDRVLVYQNIKTLNYDWVKAHLNAGRSVTLVLEFFADYANLQAIRDGAWDYHIDRIARAIKADGRQLGLVTQSFSSDSTFPTLQGTQVLLSRMFTRATVTSTR